MIPGFIGLFATIIGAIAAGNITLIVLGLSGGPATFRQKCALRRPGN